MIADNPSKTWSEFGDKDPYYGVLSISKFRLGELTTATKSDFFSTGEAWVAYVHELLTSNGCTMPAHKVAVDFGCGAGRLSIPLASRWEKVVAVDISPAYLALTGENANFAAMRNIETLATPQYLGALERNELRIGIFHSCLVFQHMPVDAGLKVLKLTLNALAENGLVVIQLPVHGKTSVWKSLAKVATSLAPPVRVVVNKIFNRPAWQRPMQMNSYELDVLLSTFETNGAAVKCMIPHHDGEFVSATVVAQKGAPIPPHPSWQV